MPNLFRINNSNPVLFLCKFIKNSKGDKVNGAKLSMVTHYLSMDISINKNMMFNFILVSYICMVKKVTLVSMFASAATLNELES